MGVVVRRYNYRFHHNITSPYTPLVLYSSFLQQQHPYLFVHLKNVFLFLLMLFLCNIANLTFLKEHSRSFKNRDHANMVI